MGDKKTPTRFEWSFVDSGDGTGRLLQRYSRTLPYELWLMGMERPLDREMAAGKFIIEPGGGHREAKRVIWPFSVDPDSAEAVLELIAVSGFRAGPFPIELVEGILRHCDLGDPFPNTICERDIERIASAVVERLAA